MTTILRQTTLDIQTCRLKDHGRQRPEDRSRDGYCVMEVMPLYCLLSRLRVANSTNDGFRRTLSLQGSPGRGGLASIASVRIALAAFGTLFMEYSRTGFDVASFRTLLKSFQCRQFRMLLRSLCATIARVINMLWVFRRSCRIRHCSRVFRVTVAIRMVCCCRLREEALPF